jgi:peptide/nickel transport system substrate-binding protein
MRIKWYGGQIMVVLVLVLLLAACGQAQPQPTQPATQAEDSPPTEAATPAASGEDEGEGEGEGESVVVVADEAERRKTVIWDMDTGQVEEPTMWNPFRAESRREKGFHQSMVEPVFILNYETGVIEPWLGEVMTSNRAMDEWTLTLREGGTWSDGEAFDADDVVFTVQAMLDDPQLDTYFGVTEWVIGVEKVDDFTVRFQLKDANPRFQVDYFSVKFWGSFPIVPEHIWSTQEDLWEFENYDPEQGWPVFTGPYTVDSISPDQFVYVRDEDWWGAASGFKPLPRPEQLIWVANDTEEDRVTMAANQQLDSIGDITLEAFRNLQAQNPNITAWFDGLPYSWMDPCSRLLSLNNVVAPWDTKDMRWAVNFALDREAIVEEAYAGTTLASKHFFPGYPPLNRYVQLLDEAGLYDTYPLTTHDPARAKQLIEAQGWEMGSDGYYERDGEVLTLDIQVLDEFIEKQQVAAVIAEQLEAVGIQSEVIPEDNETWQENLNTGQYQAIIDWEACSSVHEPWASMDRYHARWVKPVGEAVTGRNNHVRWENAKYSALVDEIGVLPLGDPQIDTLFVDAMEIWLDELPFIPVTQAKKLIPFDTTYWSGWPTQDNNYVHPPTWWQSTHMIIHNLEPVEEAP